MAPKKKIEKHHHHHHTHPVEQKQLQYRQPRSTVVNSSLSTPSTLKRMQINAQKPTKSEIISLYAHDHENIYYDYDGRIYIPSTTDTQLYRELKTYGDVVDNEKYFLFWIFLPTKRSGLFVDTSRDSANREPAIGIDDNVAMFPDADNGEEILLINNDDDSIQFTCTIESYHEKIDLNTRVVTAVIKSYDFAKYKREDNNNSDDDSDSDDDESSDESNDENDNNDDDDEDDESDDNSD